MSNGAPILLAEDEETDAMILRMAMTRAGLPHSLHVVPDGREAVAYLQGDPPYSDRSRHPIPKLLLLDLKMPRMTGFDVLRWLSNQPGLSRLPAVVLTSSSQEGDMEKARQLGASDYHVKPQSLAELVALLKALEKRWLADGPFGAG